jgi:mRNA interferase RelE/StbE
LVWQIDLTESAKKQLSKLDRQAAKRIMAFLRERVANSENPRQSGRALAGPLGGLWRYRVGNYRIICEIQDDAVRVLVVKIGDRRDVYRPAVHEPETPPCSRRL